MEVRDVRSVIILLLFDNIFLHAFLCLYGIVNPVFVLFRLIGIISFSWSRQPTDVNSCLSPSNYPI